MMCLLRRVAAVLGLTALCWTTGCAGFWVAVGNSSGSTTTPTNDYVYVANATTETVSGFAVGTGTLTPVTGTSYSLGFPPTAVAVNPADSILFVGSNTAIYAFAINSSTGALSVLNDTQSYGAFKLDETQAMVELLMRLHGHGFNVAIVFFGFYCVLIGFLIFRSMFMPRIIGVLMALGGAAYVGSALAGFLSLPVPMALSRLVPVLGGLGELSLMLWLLVVGLDEKRWWEQADPNRQ